MTEACVVRLTDKVEDVRYETVKDTLERGLASLPRWKAEGYVPTKCICIFVDEHGGSYRIKTQRSAQTVSETVALLEITKSCEINSMGFHVE